MAMVITLLTDFGLQDGYVASMKGAILNLCPEAVLIDISHAVEAFDVRAAAYLLKASYSHFPEGTVHLAVVDPGVGSPRKALALQTHTHAFVGPDNGIFSWILKEEPAVQAHAVHNPSYQSPWVSPTFHGRDVFAPVAAHLARGIPIDLLGPSHRPVIAAWVHPTRTPDSLQGEVVHIDRFGNLITNITRHDLGPVESNRRWQVLIGSHATAGWVESYHQAAPGTPVALVGSSGHLEISFNLDSAAALLHVRPGDTVRLTAVPLYAEGG